jgi:hypothetical protein
MIKGPQGSHISCLDSRIADDVTFCLNGCNEWDEEGEHQKLDEWKGYVICYSSRESTLRRQWVDREE